MHVEQPGHAEEVALPAGRMTPGIVRRGGQLLRPMGPWSGAVHEYLRHLESVGFAGAPRVLGTEGDREILTFIDGEVATDPQWRPGRGHRLPPYARSEAALVAAAALVRQLHEAARGYRPDRVPVPSASATRRGDRFTRRPRPVEHRVPFGNSSLLLEAGVARHDGLLQPLSG